LQVTRQRAKLEKNLGSIADLNRLPAALFVVDIQKEMNAVKEASRLNIPVIAMVDTCCDPTPIDFVIPANDDAAKSIAVIVNIFRQAISEGLNERKMEKDKEVSMDLSEEEDTEAPVKRTRSRRQRIDESRKEEAPVKEEAAPVKEEAAPAEKTEDNKPE
ncbi:MAG: 30S ribosomal protein S2, partial [Bacteroidales bacterium]|nr:30S ribosomal protein S2 [Bacteroidales bacterium]